MWDTLTNNCLIMVVGGLGRGLLDLEGIVLLFYFIQLDYSMPLTMLSLITHISIISRTISPHFTGGATY